MADIKGMQKYPAFDRHNIPYSFEYTERLVTLLMRIAETKPYIEQYIGKPLEVHLLRQAKILAITYSNQIEGNKLEERGVNRILEDGDLETSDTDVLEVRNYCDALEYVELLAKEKNNPTLRDMCDLQKMITHNLLKDKKLCWNIRTIKVEIVAMYLEGNR